MMQTSRGWLRTGSALLVIWTTACDADGDEQAGLSSADAAAVTATGSGAGSDGGGAPGNASDGSISEAGSAPSTLSDAGRDAGARLGADAGRDAGEASSVDASQTDAGPAGAELIVTIKNGGFWLDTAGNRIEAHGGGFLFANDAWYWIGEDKSGNNFKAVNCYRSTDLSHWEFRHAIITRQTSSELNAADRIIERPKVIYNATTKKYVMWLHWEGMSYATAEAGVFSSDAIDGDYTQVRHFRPNNNMSRDDTLFRDDDGKAYFLSAANNNADSALYELTDDYTNMKRQISTLWPGSYREAPAIMKAGTSYFIVNSGATNWDPNQQKYASASSMNGPWSALANIGDATGFDTQSAFIIPVKGTKTTTYIYAGDRWQDPDLKSSKYIWLPIKVSGNKLTMDKYDSWQLNVTTGEWNALGKDAAKAGTQP
jgi:Glycosyl hydrolases family 43